MLNRYTRIACFALIAASTSLSLPAAAQNFGFYINVDPPEPRYEAIPQARRGYTWNAGHWEWRAKRHIWVKGNWLRNRPGYVYQQPRWEQRNRDQRWALQRGRWNKDRHDNHENDGRSRPHPQRDQQHRH